MREYDFHGLTIQQITPKLLNIIYQYEGNDGGCFIIITGKGTKALATAVCDICDEMDLNYSFLPDNSGAIKICV